LEREAGAGRLSPHGAPAAAWLPIPMNLLFLISLICAFAALAIPKIFGLMGRRR
jgi:hypothetical protein